MTIQDTVHKTANAIYTRTEPIVSSAYEKVDPYVPQLAKNAAVFGVNTTVSAAKLTGNVASSALDMSSKVVQGGLAVTGHVASSALSLTSKVAHGSIQVTKSAAGVVYDGAGKVKDVGVGLTKSALGYVKGEDKGKENESKNVEE